MKGLIIALGLLGIVVSSQASQEAKPIWIEAERPESANLKFGTGAPGRPELLSDGKWLTITGSVPEEGALLSYSFHSDSRRREIWHRVGFEAARSPFEWRIDAGDWKRVDPKTHTFDLEELAEWNGVAWMDMGGVDLSEGDHKLSIHIPRPAKGDVLYGSDAFALVEGVFHPDGKWQPGQNHQLDRDRLAAQRRFQVSPSSGSARQTMPLGGDWEIARDDELNPSMVATPMTVIDPHPVWSAISVPGDKSKARPDLTLAHRVWYRTHVTVPNEQAGRSFVLTFRQNSLNTTVIVNGKLCGFNKNPFVLWDCDVTGAIHAGDNEVLVGIRDAWYGFTQNPKDPGAIWESFAIPQSRDHQGFLNLDYPVWGCFQSGMLDTPEITISGTTYVSDVFVKPSVSKHRLDAEVTLKRNDSTAGTIRLTIAATDPNKNAVIKTWPSIEVNLSAGEAKTISVGGEWTDPELWWPDNPELYNLKVTLEEGKQVKDSSETPFGFREWTVDGPHYRLNGIIWHGWAELVQGDDPQTWLANYRKTKQRFQRMPGTSQNGGIRWLGMPYDAALDWCDQNGVTVRRCGPLDGEAIGYLAIDDNGGINKPLLANVRDQIVAQVKGERNHPSVNFWSVENEWLYINCINLYGGLMDDFEADMAKTIAAVHEIDPTRLAMTDGGGAGKANILPVQGDHYAYTNDPNDYPNLAYSFQPNGAGRGRWVYDGKRPRYAGEDYFATGINPADYAWIQGEEAFGGKAAAHRGMAKVQRMITEGYRWAGVYTAFHLWIGDEGKEFHDKYVANADRAVFVRQYDTAFTSGISVVRTLGVFNDSHSSAPLTLKWSLAVGRKVVQSETKMIAIAPGESSKFDITLHLPKVLARTEGALDLSLWDGATLVFRDAKPLTVLPEPNLPKNAIGVYDPSGMVSKFLTDRSVPFRALHSLGALPNDLQTLLIGPDALTNAESTDPRFAAYALDGHRVIVLEQKNPLKFGALPIDLQPASGGGSFGFADDPSHPTLKGLKDHDFQGWGPNSRLYENPYTKVARGLKSLIEVGPRLSQTALAEVPIGKGLVVLCQLQVGHYLSRGGAARNLLGNLLTYVASYHQMERPVRAFTADHNLTQAMDAIGLRRSDASDPISALGGEGIAVISATPENLHILAENLLKVRAFTSRGGYLVLIGLTPKGLADYNKIVDVAHIIRPFRREKTGLATPRDPLAAGLTTGDVVMYSGEKMFDFNDDRFVSSDIFDFIVDTDDVAPFASLPNDYFYNTVNGFVSSDGWKYIFSFELKNGPPEYTMTFPKTMSFKELTWIGNGFYHKVKRIGLSFDGGPMMPFEVQPNTDPQVLEISPARSAKSIRLAILDWTKDLGVGEVVGIDNIYFKVNRPTDWYEKVKPLMNIGGLVRYPQGKGAVVLVNLAFRDKEEVPENIGKKRSILATVLRNLGATFSGGANLVVPGARGVVYTPISLAGKATGYRNERGWFGDSNHTLADLPAGHQTFANVPFDVYEFSTSPVPTAVILGGSGVPGNLPDHVDGIKVGQKANALFFLQTARIDQPRNDQENREGKRFELARYVVTYADGTVVKVPVFEELDVDNYRQKNPRDLPGARVAWSKAFADGSDSATAYVMQWTNPRPDVVIATIGLQYGNDRRGVPVLLAVTAAK
jgi:beta-galactosidase